MIENPLKWQSRIRNYHNFAIQFGGVDNILHTAEIAFGDRDFEITQDDNPYQLQLRTDCEIWHQRNAYNLLIQRMPPEVEYVAWVDADVHFCNPNWASDTIEQLKHYDIVQMFSHAQNLDAKFRPIGVVRPSYFYQYVEEGEIYGGLHFWGSSKNKIPPEKNAHPGLAWAAKKSVLSKLGMLIDWTIVGSADFHMAAALLGELETEVDKHGYHEAYVNKCRVWQDRAVNVVKQNIGYVPGLVCHYWHGGVKNRQYDKYQEILVKHQYNPETDITKDWQGLNVLTGANPALRDEIRKYIRSRNEDE